MDQVVDSETEQVVAEVEVVAQEAAAQGAAVVAAGTKLLLTELPLPHAIS